MNLLMVIIASANIVGAVIDAKSKMPVSNAYVWAKPEAAAPVTASTDLDGMFYLEVPAAKIQLKISKLGYEQFDTSLVVSEGQKLEIRILLQPKPLILPAMKVVATRAELGEPIPVSRFNPAEIARIYTHEDPPEILDRMPGVFGYSDEGLGIGGTYVNVRGFSANRVSVLINGVPVNDPESQDVYWVDYPDILSDAGEVQVQRGVGNSVYGTSAFGGLINILTKDFSKDANVSAYVGYGSFNTRKVSASFSTGRIFDNWAFYGRFSRITTDGWREQSWVKKWSYFFGGEYFTQNSVTRVHFWGGPEKLHLSYWGITKEQFEENPRCNPLEYKNEIDNFYQPHYELIHSHQISDALSGTFTLFYVPGEGYVEQFREDQKLTDYLLPIIIDTTVDSAGNTVIDTITESNLIRQRWVKERQIGLIAQFDYRPSERTNFIFGLGGMHHRGHHWADVIWAEHWPPNLGPRHRYYDFMMDRPFVWAFVRASQAVTQSVSLFSDLSVQYRAYKFYDDKRDSITFDIPYTFVLPKLGVTYAKENLKVFASVAYSKREPTARDIYDATHPYESTPLLDEDGNPLIKPEKLVDLELGLDWKSDWLSVELTGYRMDFRDELLPNGDLSDEGTPRVGNAARSVHQGVEISSEIKPTSWLTLLITGAKAFDRVMEMEVFEPRGDTVVKVVYKDKLVPGYPHEKFNLRAEISKSLASSAVRKASFWSELEYRGKIYVDVGNSEEFAIDPVTTVNIGAQVDLRNGLTFGVKVLNLTDKKYLQYGVYDAAWGEAYYYPAASRVIFGFVKFNMPL